MKVWHLMFLAAAVLGALYVYHMTTSHQGSGILPGVGLKLG
jgi:hypothetical protein